MKRITLFLIICLTGSSVLFAQQVPLNYQYMIDPYSLNPAMAGMNGGFEAYLGIKKDRLDADYSPRTITFDMNAPLGKKVAIGGLVMDDQAGIFRNTYAQLSYTFHARFGENHGLGMSIFGGINAKRIGLNDINVQATNDPLFNGKQEMKETALNYGAALNYHLKGLNLGISVPGLYSDNNKFYEFKRHYVGHVSYQFNVAPKWQLTPVVILRGAEVAPWNYEGTAIVTYDEKYYLGATYRKNSIGAFSLGGFLTDNIVLHYAYDFTLPFDDYRGVIGDKKGGHEIAIGYRFNGKKPNKKDLILEELQTKSRATQVDSLSQLTKDLQERLRSLSDSLNMLNRSQEDIMRKALDESKMNRTTDAINRRTETIETDVNALNQKIMELESTLETTRKRVESRFRTMSTRDAVRDDNKPVDAGYYVVIGSFRVEANAKRAVEIYKDVNPFIIHNVSRSWYYVYSNRFDQLQPALDRMRELRAEPGRFDDAWVHIYRN